MTAERWLTPTDRALLVALARTPNLVRASRSLGIGRDRALYRLRRLARLYGRPVAEGHRGRGAIGSTTLTPFGRRLTGAAPRARSNRWTGTYRSEPQPRVEFGDGRRLAVSFRARSNAPVRIEVDPEAFVIARRRFESSARNVLPVEIASLSRRAPGRVEVTARWNGLPVRAVLTPLSAKRLRLARGRAVYFYVKAVAVRRV